MNVYIFILLKNSTNFTNIYLFLFYFISKKYYFFSKKSKIFRAFCSKKTLFHILIMHILTLHRAILYIHEFTCFPALTFMSWDGSARVSTACRNPSISYTNFQYWFHNTNPVLLKSDPTEKYFLPKICNYLLLRS